VVDDSIYVWDIPSLRDYVLNFNYTTKDAFEIYMRDKGCDVPKLWEKMDDAIVKLLLDNERNVIAETGKTLCFFSLRSGCHARRENVG
jgi:hypothetical protein